MRRFNSIVFIICSIALAFLAYESYIQAVAIDEGRAGNSGLRHWLGDFFNVMRFPMHVLFKTWSRQPVNFAIGLIINCLLYAFILERIFQMIFGRKVDAYE
jgi:hypothetical protein